MKNILTITSFFAIILMSCAPDKPKNKEEFPEQPATPKAAVETAITDPTKGIGAVKNVESRRN